MQNRSEPLGRRSLLGWTLASSVMMGASLAPGGTRPATAQAADPRQPVAELNAALLSTMRLSGASFQQRFDRLAPVIDRVFDLNIILGASVGLRWNTLDEASRRALYTIFRAYTVANYASNFDSDSGERFDIQTQPRASGSDQVVLTTLTTGKGERIELNYVVRAGTGGWKIVDVLLNGSISQVAVNRSDFRSLLASGDVNPLIESLRRKVSELSGGAMRL